MSEPGPSPRATPPRSRRDRWVKVGFLLVAAAAVVWIYRDQLRGGAVLTNWSEDLPAALAHARAEDRRVLLLFLHAQPTEEERRLLIGNTIPKNEHHIDEGRYLRVKVLVPTDMDSPLVRQYEVKQIPTLVVLSSQGKEMARTTTIGETDWGRFLLDPNSPAK